MLYRSEGPSVRSLDVAGADTPNRSRYQNADCFLRLNAQGLPVAIHYVRGQGESGASVPRRYRVVKPNGVVALSYSALIAWMNEVAHPVN